MGEETHKIPSMLPSVPRLISSLISLGTEVFLIGSKTRFKKKNFFNSLINQLVYFIIDFIFCRIVLGSQ